MKVVCAWCLEEGKPALVGPGEGALDDPEETRGVRLEHKRRVKTRPLESQCPTGQAPPAARRIR
jgi:hypothetical protein